MTTTARHLTPPAASRKRPLPTTLFLSGLVDAVPAALAQWRRCIKLAWVDGGYAGKLVTWAQARLKPKLALQIVKRPDDLHRFQVLPRRWLVERTLAWITRSRRTVRDYERLTAHHETIIYRAMIITMSRRLARRSRPRLA